MKKVIYSLLTLWIVTVFTVQIANADETSTEKEIKAYFYTKEGVAMRNKPDKAGKTLIVIPKNKKVTAVARKDDWYKVTYGKYTGWVLKGYLTKETSKTTTTTTTNKNSSANKGDATTDTKGNVNSGTYVDPNAPKFFQNCTALRKYYPSGVQKGHPAYAGKHDRDKDGWACESK